MARVRFAGLIADARGNLFGTTREGGAYGQGSVFKIAKTDRGYATTTLVSFNGTNGANPWAGLIAGAKGQPLRHDLGRRVFELWLFFKSGCGTVFEIAKTPAATPPPHWSASTASMASIQ